MPIERYLELWSISIALCKTAVTTLLTHWSYCSPALSHRYLISGYQNNGRFWRKAVASCRSASTYQWVGYLFPQTSRRPGFCALPTRIEEVNFYFKDID